VVMKSIIFLDIMPCSPLRVNWRFGGTYRLHLQGRRISRARTQRGSRWQTELCIQIICTHWMNLRTTFAKQLHILRSVNQN
jgi:hypothetical protein